jgi:hypothetical protein
MAPKMLEYRGYTALVPMSFWATSFVMFMIMTVMMPAMGVAHKHSNVMPVGRSIAEGYQFGPVNAMSVILVLFVSQMQWLYIIYGVDSIPDATEKSKKMLKIFYWTSIVALGFLLGLPPVKAKIGPFKYGLHEIASNIWMVASAIWLTIFAQWAESSQARNGIAIGCAISVIGVAGNLIESGIHNQQHGGPFQFLGLAVMLGVQLMTMFGCENYTYTLWNARGFDVSEKAVSSSSKAAADTDAEYSAV